MAHKEQTACLYKFAIIFSVEWNSSIFKSTEATSMKSALSSNLISSKLPFFPTILLILAGQSNKSKFHREFK